MRKVDIIMSVGADGFYSAYCSDHPALFGGGNTPAEALDELRETLRLVKQDGRELAFIYPDWLDEPFEFQTMWNIKDLMTYYAHGVSKPRKAQLQKMESALQQLGRELMHVSFC